jgi:polyisoprenoid-binding protein YceI
MSALRVAPLAASLVLLTAAAPTAHRATLGTASDSTWTADPVHSSAEFDVVHLGITHVKGTIPIASIQATVPGGAVAPSGIQATLDVNGVSTNNAKRDADLRSDHFFDVAHYPTIAFQSTQVSTVGADSTFTISGTLTMHGVTKPVTLKAHFDGRIAGMDGHPRAAYRATTTVDRRDFGMTYGLPVAGASVTISLSVEAASK